MFGLGTWELIAILAVAALLFGASRLPELGRGLGKAIHGFRRAVSGEPAPGALDGATGAPKGEPPK
jgi:sec-independent protein translocase protein TatA